MTTVPVFLITLYFCVVLEKFLLMLRSLNRGLLVDSEHPQMHENIVDFILTGVCVCVCVCVCAHL